jgi:nucleotide-binding universal stress UspA family protein
MVEFSSICDQKSGSTDEPSKIHVHTSFPCFERILVAYDGMYMSKKALGYAAYISQISNSEIVVINIVKAGRDPNNMLPATIKVNLQGKEDEVVRCHQGSILSDVLREVVEEMKTACKANGVKERLIFEIREGNPAEEIINLSNLMRFDLIVMGSRRIASRMRGIGSTTRKIATTSKTPILIVQKQRRYKDEW